jgi:hypothetical protein
VLPDTDKMRTDEKNDRKFHEFSWVVH